MIPFAAVILAAGRSRRMRRPKAWLEYEGLSLLERIARSAAGAGAARLIVVAGCEDASDAPDLVGRIGVAEHFGEAVALPRLSVAIGKPDGQPIASIRAGLELVPEQLAVLLWPVDQPFADAALVSALARALGDAPDRIVAPAVDGKRVHPVLLGPCAAAELASHDADGGAHLIIRREPARVVTVPAQDRRLLAELNTPEQAAALGVR